MSKYELDQKILSAFSSLTINKEVVRNLNIRDKRTIPSFVEEWLVDRFHSESSTELDTFSRISEFMSKHLPDKSEKNKIKYAIQKGESTVLLDRFEVRIDIVKDKRILSIPCIDENSATITKDVLDSNHSLLEGGQWGAGRLNLGYDGKQNIIELVDFSPMESGFVVLSELIKARESFTTKEWIYVLLRSMGYEPFSYTESQQRCLLLRLIPLVQNNINMMELAPKGTGKSFIYSNLSRYTWLNSGGALSEAQLFFNLSTKQVGLFGNYDLLVLDEGQSINFKGADDIHAKFKNYLESGEFSRGNKKVSSECGLMILANIDIYENKPMRSDYIKHLPEMFHDDALIDRFHGIIPGWEIPRFTTDKAAQGYGIKADVFGQYMHQLRLVSHLEFPFGESPEFKGDIRDKNAVTRLCKALSKLLLINPGHEDYQEYVLEPSISLRRRVRTQLAELNPNEFSNPMNLTY
ncbi:MAG: BREX system Lon protease-like protein BrxL [Cocleimonas sp.]|jgi:ATP-dependent Lon protease